MKHPLHQVGCIEIYLSLEMLVVSLICHSYMTFFFWFLPFLDIAFWILISDFHEDVNFVTVYSTCIDLVSKRDYHVLARCRT